MSVDRAQEAEAIENGVDGTGGAEKVVTEAAAAVRTYAVAPGVRLNVRSGPGTQYNLVRVLPEGVRVPIYCQTPGTTVSGTYGTTNIWDLIDSGEYVSDAYVQTGTDGYIAPRCG
ncbi:SH3 domain-containing protein [Streptomyces sp. MC1]|uniref:SH3 domain-containing protein n=1 Tax=Streptomyces sp. MC1 TaxID=295105 RepID=UPI0018CA0BD9|nr:SH3 domain-containing protein [Streptomyces sp. MC1]MBG7701771.1 SH3 domain-containing protein [Streptomyces sp. MC1]